MHKSVLLKEALDALNIKPDGKYIDATLGYAGHSLQILKRIKKGFLFAFDQDEEAIKHSHEKLSSLAGQNFKLFHSNFINLKDYINENVDGILFDLGVSSPQIDNSLRGFSFMNDAPLDMRMDQSSNLSAATIVNEYSEDDLCQIIFRYGEEKTARAIVKKIIERRKKTKIESTLELVEIIKKAVGLNYFNKYHPERKVFQALRIETNSELKVLEKIIPDAIDLLKEEGRLVIITFHSLEDKIVKKIFKKYSSIDEKVKGLPEIPDEYKPKVKLITKKPILPSETEIKDNPRSKSAKMRVIERI